MGKLIRALLIFLVLCIAACKNESVGAENVEFQLDEEFLYLNFEQKSSFVIIPVNTNQDLSQWSVSSNQDWCLVSQDKASSGILVSVQASEEPEVRTANVTVKYALGTIDIQVQQLGYGPAILIAPLNSTMLEASGGELQLKVTSNISYVQNISDDCDWIEKIESPDTRALTDKIFLYNIHAYGEYGADRQGIISFVGKDYPDVKEECVVLQHPMEPSTDDVVEIGDIAFKPIGGKASQFQQNFGIEKCWDGLGGDNIYQSPWSEPTVFPVTLEFDFDGTHTLDYLVYVPRFTGLGHWGKFDIYAQTTANNDYVKIGSFDFKESRNPSRLQFDKSIVNIVKLKIEIQSGRGDCINVEELYFYEKNSEKSPLEKQLLNVFTDLSCSELLEDVSNEDIQSLPGFFIDLAVRLKNGTYDEWEKKFRIQDYKPYSIPTEIAKTLCIRAYTDLDNPTGIVVNAGEELVVLVGNTYGNLLCLQSIQDIAMNGEKYLLHEGVNKFNISQDGVLFVMYNTDLTSESAQPVRIHFPLNSGHVNGYFDLERDKTDAVYQELLNKATHKYFIVKGNEVLLNFHRSKLKQYQPNEIVEYITTFDHIVNWQYDLMGFDEIRPRIFNNHINASSFEGDGYMWATDGQIGFQYESGLSVIMPVDKLRLNCWGPAHEVGHVHQGAINWTGCTESSNNLFSNYVTYKLGVNSSNGKPLCFLADRKFGNEPWGNFGGIPDAEDTELHMRMYWQLYLYFHVCGVNRNFYPELFKKLRAYPGVEQLSPGKHQMLFVKYASDVAQMDLSEFFETWGFLTPIDVTISQYGDQHYLVTEDMITEVKDYMSQYKMKPGAFQYIEDRESGTYLETYKANVGDVGYYTQFKDNMRITNTPVYSLSGQSVHVSNGDQAVAFEVWKNGKCIFFSNSFDFVLPAGLSVANCTFKAVQADGERKEMERR